MMKGIPIQIIECLSSALLYCRGPRSAAHKGDHQHFQVVSLSTG